MPGDAAAGVKKVRRYHSRSQKNPVLLPPGSKKPGVTTAGVKKARRYYRRGQKSPALLPPGSKKPGVTTAGKKKIPAVNTAGVKNAKTRSKSRRQGLRRIPAYYYSVANLILSFASSFFKAVISYSMLICLDSELYYS